MVKPTVKLLASEISHMPLHLVWRDSGVTKEHGFDLVVDVVNTEMPGQRFITFKERAPLLLDGTYDFISGLHHETYRYRARGDKRFVYLAQAQNDWDDRVIVSGDIDSPRGLEGRRFIITARAPCVFGNLRRSLQLSGVDLDRIEFVEDTILNAIEVLARGEAAGACVDAPFDLQAEKRGLRRLELPALPVIHNATICANINWVKQDEDTTYAFLRSMVDAIHFFKTQKSHVCEILERTLAPVIGLKGPDEVEYLQETWAQLLSPKPYPHPLAVWNVYALDANHDPDTQFIGPFEPWDTSYVRAIDDSGYIDELYGGARLAVNPGVNAAI